MVWQVLDVGAVWIKEFASALSQQAATLGWLPHISNYDLLQRYEQPKELDNPPLKIREFPLQRGYSYPILWLCCQETSERIFKHGIH